MVSKLDRLYLMSLFTNVVRQGSFQAAATALQITPSKASKDIQYLENTLDSKLLNRTTRTLNLTDAGVHYYAKAQEILRLYDGMRDDLASMKEALKGTLRITAPELWGRVVLTPILLSFQRKNPEVAFNCIFSNDVMDLVKNNIHIAFRSTTLSDEPYLAKTLCSDRTILCASQSYLRSEGAPTDLKDLQNLNFIHFSEAGAKGGKLIFNNKGKTHECQVSGSLAFNSKWPVFEAVKQGLGIAALPEYLVGESINDESLVEVLPHYQLEPLYYHALYTQHRKDSLLISTFIDYVKDALLED